MKLFDDSLPLHSTIHPRPKGLKWVWLTIKYVYYWIFGYRLTESNYGKIQIKNTMTFEAFIDSEDGNWINSFGDINTLEQVKKYLKEDWREFKQFNVNGTVKEFLQSDFPRIAGWYQTLEVWQKVARVILRDFERFNE